VSVFFSDEQDEPLDVFALRSFAGRVLKEEGLPDTTEVAVLMVTPDQITSYNETFMERSGPTDVLAFPVEALLPGEPPEQRPGDPPIALGDVFLCPTEIFNRAREERFEEEGFLFLLLAHGLLHLLGYDHDSDGSAQTMENREDQLLAMIGKTLT